MRGLTDNILARNHFLTCVRWLTDWRFLPIGNHLDTNGTPYSSAQPIRDFLMPICRERWEWLKQDWLHPVLLLRVLQGRLCRAHEESSPVRVPADAQGERHQEARLQPWRRKTEPMQHCNHCKYASFCHKNLKTHMFFYHFISFVPGLVIRLVTSL